MAIASLTFACDLSYQIEEHHLVEFARRVEELGYDRIVTGEHIQNGNPPRPINLSLPLMAAAAAATKRIRVMTGIVIVPLYHPVMLAKLVTSVDRVSNGRLDFGIGLSGQRGTRIEYDIMGVPVETRGRRANEMLPLLRRLWTEEHVTHSGQFYQFEDATLLPQPTQKPCPPIWVSGRSDAAMKRAGTMGDGWYPYLLSLPRLKESNAAVRKYGEAAGRDMSKFHFSVNQPVSIADDPKVALAIAAEKMGGYATADRSPEDIVKRLCIAGTVNDCIKGVQDLIDAGVRDFVFTFLAKDEHDTHRQMEIMARQVLPNFR